MSPSVPRRAGRLVAAAFLLAASITSAQTKTFAPSVVGTPVVLEGQLVVVVEDYADGRSRLRHFLKTRQDRIELEFAGKPPQLPSGTRVRVHGTAKADVLALDGSAGSIEPLTTQPPNKTMGEQSVAVLLVNFQDDASQPKTVAEAQSLVFGDTSNHYLESSFGQTWFKGETFGWYTLAMSKAACDPYTLATLADQKAAQAGVNLAAYQRRVYMFPANSCLWLGLGDVGGTSTQAWVNGTMTLQVVGHELGHNLGLYHAHSLDCDTGVYGKNCVKYNYGDAADLMGNNRAGQFNPFEKELLGWLNDGISPPITTVATGGRYSIEPYSASTVGPKALKIPRGTDALGAKLWFYVEYRQPISGDGVLGNTGNLTQGVMVRTATEDDRNSSFQLDMSPGSSTQYFDEAADGALAVGQSHYDPDSGVTLTLASTSGTGADIDVLFGAPTCTRAAPEVWVGPNRTSYAGTTIEYELQVTNLDSIACPPTTFALAGIVPAGWTGTPGMAALTLKPGTAGYTTLNVTSPATAALGEYKIWAATSSPDSALHTAQNPMNAWYVVVAPCVRATPTIALTGGGTAVRAGTPVAYTLRVTNRDGSTCAGTSFSLASSVPPGWTGKLDKTSVALDPGQAASVALNVVSDAAATVGSYGIGAATSSPVGALHTANASVTYDVASTCTRAAPTVSLTGGTGGAPGTAVAYTLSVTNRDSSACDATTFKLARSAPTGWGSTLSSSAMALSPGATDTAVLNVSSPPTASAGSYGIGAATSSPVGALHTANVSATYLVTPPCTRAAPTVSLTGGGTVVAAGSTVGYTLSVTNRDSSACPATTFSLARSVPSGWLGTLGRTSMTLGPGGSASALLNVASPGTAAGGRYGVGVATGSPIGALHTANASTTYLVAPKLSIADTSLVEGNGGTTMAKFAVSLAQPAVVPVTFSITTTNGTAAAGSDYTATSLAGITIPAGSSRAVVSVPVIGETAIEANETFQVLVSNVSGATVSDGAATGTIRNDDTRLSIGDVSIVEGNAGAKSATFTVKLTNASASAVTFNLATASKTAVAGSDYAGLGLAGESIPAGSTSKVFNVTINGDTVRESDETFVVNVGSISGAAIGDAQGLGTIVNDD